MAINPAQAIIQTHAASGGESSNVNRSEAGVQSFKVVPVAKEAPPPETRKMDPAQLEARLKDATHRLNQFMKITSINLHFSVDSDNSQIVVKVLNKQTGEVIRQIPSEEALKLSKAMDTLQGLIIRETV